jgi:hypothetical protein
MKRLTGGVLLEAHHLVVTHGAHDSHIKGLSGFKLSTELIVKAIGEAGQLEVILSVSVLCMQKRAADILVGQRLRYRARPLLPTSQQGEESIIRDVKELVLRANNIGHAGGVRGGNNIFKLLASKDINCGKVCLGVAVLSGLGSGYIRHLAWAPLNHNVASLADLPSIHGNGVTASTRENMWLHSLERGRQDLVCKWLSRPGSRIGAGEVIIIELILFSHSCCGEEGSSAT